MLYRQIEKSYQEIQRLDCCHHDDRACCCYNCLRVGFHETPDEYECVKKLNYYVGKYAASYTSEIYNYLVISRVIDQFRDGPLSVLSLGCGFSPDYYAISRYIEDNRLNITLDYTGIDSSPQWDEVRIDYPNTNFVIANLLDEFRINGFDIVFMNKLFSTIYKHKSHNVFLSNLKTAIDLTDNDEVILVFNDVNSIYMGRDIFNRHINPKFRSVRMFYTGNPPHIEANWLQLQNDMVFPILRNELIDPLNQIRNYIYFEYRK